MGIKCGIVGLFNVGKLILFNVLIKVGIVVVNFLFCMIELNVGIVLVLDLCLNELVVIINLQKVILIVVEFVDIVGLVVGVVSGEGLGNKFLVYICEVDVIIYVVCCFENVDVIYVNNKVDLILDIDIIDIELVLVDLDSVEKVLNCVECVVKGGDKDVVVCKLVLVKLQVVLFDGKVGCIVGLDEEEKVLVCDLFLFIFKLVMYIVNVLEDGFENNLYLDVVCVCVVEEGVQVVLVLVVIEEELFQFDDDDCDIFLVDLGLFELGLNCVINVVYNLFGLQIYFIVGVKEVCVWIVCKGVIVLQVVVVIYIDFEKGFICVEIIVYDDFIKYKGEVGVKEVGCLCLEGKEYCVQEGDILYFCFNV